MKFTMKFKLDTSEHSPIKRKEASKWLHYLSRHLDENIDDAKFQEMIGVSQPIKKQWGKKIGYYKIEKAVTKQPTLTEMFTIKDHDLLQEND